MFDFDGGDQLSMTELIIDGSCVQLLDPPDCKVHGANMGPIWGRQDPGGSHVGPMNLAIWGVYRRGPNLVVTVPIDIEYAMNVMSLNRECRYVEEIYVTGLTESWRWDLSCMKQHYIYIYIYIL